MQLPGPTLGQVYLITGQDHYKTHLEFGTTTTTEDYGDVTSCYVLVRPGDRIIIPYEIEYNSLDFIDLVVDGILRGSYKTNSSHPVMFTGKAEWVPCRPGGTKSALKSGQMELQVRDTSKDVPLEEGQTASLVGSIAIQIYRKDRTPDSAQSLPRDPTDPAGHLERAPTFEVHRAWYDLNRTIDPRDTPSLQIGYANTKKNSSGVKDRVVAKYTAEYKLVHTIVFKLRTLEELNALGFNVTEYALGDIPSPMRRIKKTPTKPLAPKAPRGKYKAKAPKSPESAKSAKRATASTSQHESDNDSDSEDDNGDNVGDNDVDDDIDEEEELGEGYNKAGANEFAASDLVGGDEYPEPSIENKGLPALFTPPPAPPNGTKDIQKTKVFGDGEKAFTRSSATSKKAAAGSRQKNVKPAPEPQKKATTALSSTKKATAAGKKPARCKIAGLKSAPANQAYTQRASTPTSVASPEQATILDDAEADTTNVDTMRADVVVDAQPDMDAVKSEKSSRSGNNNPETSQQGQAFSKTVAGFRTEVGTHSAHGASISPIQASNDNVKASESDVLLSTTESGFFPTTHEPLRERGVSNATSIDSDTTQQGTIEDMERAVRASMPVVKTITTATSTRNNLPPIRAGSPTVAVSSQVSMYPSQGSSASEPASQVPRVSQSSLTTVAHHTSPSPLLSSSNSTIVPPRVVLGKRLPSPALSGLAPRAILGKRKARAMTSTTPDYGTQSAQAPSNPDLAREKLEAGRRLEAIKKRNQELKQNKKEIDEIRGMQAEANRLERENSTLEAQIADAYNGEK